MNMYIYVYVRWPGSSFLGRRDTRLAYAALSKVGLGSATIDLKC